MIEMSALVSAVTAFQAAKDIAQAMIGLRDGAAFQAKLIEFQSKILDAQSSVFAANEERSTLIERIRALEKEVADLKAWEAEKQRYELKPMRNPSGPFAYALKEDAQPPEPAHWLCATCYQRCQKGVLQRESRSPGRATVYVCHSCGTDLYVSGEVEPEHSRPKR